MKTFDIKMIYLTGYKISVLNVTFVLGFQYKNATILFCAVYVASQDTENASLYLLHQQQKN